MQDYGAITPITTALTPARQADPRHYGAHPYFTRRPANVVRAYVERFSRPGDVVLDPFGGTGVTAIEAMLLGRRAVHNDLNPLANFITATIAELHGPRRSRLDAAFARIEAACEGPLAALAVASDADVAAQLGALPLPDDAPLPASADVPSFHQLFTPRQLAGLAMIKAAIEREPEAAVRAPLLLAFSATVAKLNRTFISARGRAASRGGSSIFSIYRYKVARAPVELPLWATFFGRWRRVLAARADVACQAALAPAEPVPVRVFAQDAAALLDTLGPACADYIFTDPPYGAHIAYLDLSTMWNHWLGLPVTPAMRADEAIVGGDLKLGEEHYRRKLRDSLSACVALLRPGRWLSVVFQHWDLGYFATILDATRSAGAELRAAVTQEADLVWSMHQKKGRGRLLAGELILTFYKPVSARVSAPATTVPPPGVDELLRDVAAQLERDDAGGAFRTETLFNHFVLAAWQRGALPRLDLPRDEFLARLAAAGFAYDAGTRHWRLGAATTELFPVEGTRGTVPV